MPEAKEVILRDPLYGYVDLSPEEIEVIDTPAFQRLRGIKQVAHTHLVYPSAIHTRFAHSIGTMHVAGLMADRLYLTREERRLVRLAALLHDIGHGPFSHLFEEVTQAATGSKVDHELVGRAIVSTDQALHSALRGDRRKVLDILSGKSGIQSKIVSGGVDSDKMDYFRRDSFHAGVRYGEYDFDRILRTLKRHNEHIVIPKKGWDAMEGFLMAREQLYLQVYYHSTRIIADETLKRVVELAASEGYVNKTWLTFDPDSPDEFLRRFMGWDDSSFIAMLKAKTRGNPLELLIDLTGRRLLKKAFYKDVQELDAIPKGELTSNRERLKELEHYIARSTHTPAHRVFAKIPAVSMKQYYLKGGEELYALKDDGDVDDFIDVSKIKGPSEDLLRIIVFGPREKRGRIRRATERFLSDLR